MKSKTSKHGLKRMTALLLAVVLCVGMVPTAFAAQQDSYPRYVLAKNASPRCRP